MPTNLQPRCLNANAAAKYCGVSLGTLKKHGPVPIYIGTRRIYDIVALNRWIDRLSGLSGLTLDEDGDNPNERAALEAIHGKS